MENNPQHPLCYSCEYRRDIPGDSHSRCAHPALPESLPLVLLASLTANKMPLDAVGIDVRGSLHGIKMGWFCWPLNFDPVWLEWCGGYKPAEGQESNGVS